MRYHGMPRPTEGYANRPILGQQKFGKSVLEAFTGRGDTVAGVFCAPDKAGGEPDPLRRLAAESLGVPVHQLPSR
jgi:methionyl-tRNA formyltransferase